MRILVLSDSHGEKEYMRLAIKKEHPDAVIHLGDHAGDTDTMSMEFPLLPLCRIRGNCDFYETRWPEEICVQWDGITILAAHGHKYGVKNGLLRFSYAALERGARVAAFGHTHLPYCEQMGELWMLNPGACRGSRPSYGIIEINGDRIQCQVKDLFLEDII